MPHTARRGGREFEGLRFVFVVNEDWMFWSHRRSLARAVRDAGADVTVATRAGRFATQIEDEGFRLHALPWRRGASSLPGELRSVGSLARLFRRERPDLIHNVGIKSMLYGGLAAGPGGRLAQVHALTGFGFVATSSSPRAKILRGIARMLFRGFLDGPATRLVVQNPDDLGEVERGGWFSPSRIDLVRGSGVDTSEFTELAEPSGSFTVALAARLVESKGVYDLVRAARILRGRGRRDVRIVIAGACDAENPEAVSPAEVRAWEDEGIVEHAGHVEPITRLWKRAHVAVLPSYREGLPRALLEAASCGRALIATDVPGCREIVRDGDNGLLVPLRDPAALAEAIETLADQVDLRRTMGRRSRERIEREFSDEHVVARTLDVYRKILGRERSA